MTGAVMHLAQVTRYDILYVVNKLVYVQARESSHGGGQASVYDLAWSTDFSVTCKQDGFGLAAFSDAIWGKHPDNVRSVSSYIVMLANALIRFKVARQGLTA